MKQMADGSFIVESTSGADRAYKVTIEGSGTCTCPHFTYRLIGTGQQCRHIVAVHAHIQATKPTKSAAEIQAEINAEFARRQNERALAAQQERYEAAQEVARHELPSLVRSEPLTLEEATRVTALEKAASKAKRLNDEQLRRHATERNGSAAGAACWLELAARQVRETQDAELKRLFR
jgi:hypothetical protein